FDARHDSRGPRTSGSIRRSSVVRGSSDETMIGATTRVPSATVTPDALRPALRTATTSVAHRISAPALHAAEASAPTNPPGPPAAGSDGLRPLARSGPTSWRATNRSLDSSVAVPASPEHSLIGLPSRAGPKGN